MTTRDELRAAAETCVATEGTVGSFFQYEEKAYLRFKRVSGPKTIIALLDELEAAERERDLAIAHDRQPYPTAHAYEMACKARTKWQDRAEAAERVVESLRLDRDKTNRTRAALEVYDALGSGVSRTDVDRMHGEADEYERVIAKQEAEREYPCEICGTTIYPDATKETNDAGHR